MQAKDLNNLKTMKVSIKDGIAELEFCRPGKLNSMNTYFWREFPEVLQTIDREAAARVIIISAQGRHFTAGMDLEIFRHMLTTFTEDPARRSEQLRRGILELQQSFSLMEKIRIPVIACVQGACVGGGVDLICAADIRYCTSDALFTIKETELGITADVGTLQRLQYVMPSGLARELAYTSRSMDAREAISCGFVNQIYDDPSKLMEGARKIALQIARNSPVAVHGTKVMLNYSRDHSLSDSLEYVATWQAGMLQQEDLKEAVQAFKERRLANFDDLYPYKSAIE